MFDSRFMDSIANAKILEDNLKIEGSDLYGLVEQVNCTEKSFTGKDDQYWSASEWLSSQMSAKRGGFGGHEVSLHTSRIQSEYDNDVSEIKIAIPESKQQSPATMRPTFYGQLKKKIAPLNEPQSTDNS